MKTTIAVAALLTTLSVASISYAEDVTAPTTTTKVCPAGDDTCKNRSNTTDENSSTTSTSSPATTTENPSTNNDNQ
jgi:hypothetical protein